jgi:acyl-coenzyme A synthetase/AMP-(fatty) acid ligase
VLWWSDEFPRTASMKVKRLALADKVRADHDRNELTLVAP